LGTIQLLLEKMGSKLEIQSEVGIGSHFSFIISLKETIDRSKKLTYKYSFSSINMASKIKLQKKNSIMMVPEEFNEQEGIHRPYTKFNKSMIPEKMELPLKKLSASLDIVNVLVVDDCSVNRMVHKMLLEKYSNFKITEHCNGAEAVAYMKVLGLSGPKKVLILMDVNMPVMDGIEATKAIRRMCVDFPITIIAVSAFSNEKDIDKILDCGMNSYVTKPITKESLARMLALIC
jgi:CheY-like chemotaxis protein